MANDTITQTRFWAWIVSIILAIGMTWGTLTSKVSDQQRQIDELKQDIASKLSDIRTDLRDLSSYVRTLR